MPLDGTPRRKKLSSSFESDVQARAGAGSIPRCGKGFFSLSQLSVRTDSLTCVRAPPCAIACINICASWSPCQGLVDYGNTKTPRMHRTLGSATPSPNFPWEKSQWNNKVVKKKKFKLKKKKKTPPLRKMLPLAVKNVIVPHWKMLSLTARYQRPTQRCPIRKMLYHTAKCRPSTQNDFLCRKMPFRTAECCPSPQNAFRCRKMLAFTAERCPPLQNAFRCR